MSVKMYIVFGFRVKSSKHFLFIFELGQFESFAGELGQFESFASDNQRIDVHKNEY